jgi:hypothetical protein
MPVARLERQPRYRRSRQPDIRHRRRRGRLAVARKPVGGLDGGQDAVVGDRFGVVAGPHPLAGENRRDVMARAAVVFVPGEDQQGYRAS